MTKKKLPVRFTGQHFTIDKVLIKDAIRQANISNQDTVLDIGAGKGFLTVHLLKIANNVVAIENDTALVEHLRKLFSDARNVQGRIQRANALRHKVIKSFRKNTQKEYKNLIFLLVGD